MEELKRVQRRFLGHDLKAANAHAQPHKESGGGPDRYLGYDPGLKRELVVEKGETVWVSEQKAEQLMHDEIGFGKWEVVKREKPMPERAA